jgi:hypothetical protein
VDPHRRHLRRRGGRRRAAVPASASPTGRSTCPPGASPRPCTRSASSASWRQARSSSGWSTAAA